MYAYLEGTLDRIFIRFTTFHISYACLVKNNRKNCIEPLVIPKKLQKTPLKFEN